MTDRRYGPRPTPAVISQWWSISLRCTGQPGSITFHCPRCGAAGVLDLAADEIPAIVGPPQLISTNCQCCQLTGVVVLEPQPATRPPSAFIRDRDSRATPAPTPPPVANQQSAADGGLLQNIPNNRPTNPNNSDGERPEGIR
jgi:hypothetical protein